MIQVTAAVEHDLVDALGLAALGHQLANGTGCSLVAAVALDLLIQRGGSHQRIAGDVVDHLGVDIALAAEYVADALGTDQALIDAELKKILLLDPEGQVISLDQAKLMIAPQREIAAFEIRESFGDRDPIAYTKKLRELLDAGVEGIQIISALEAYAVRLLHIRTMLGRKMAAKDIAAALGANPWLFEKKLNEPRKALNWSPQLLCRVIKRLGELDSDIKNGICDSRMGLELSLAALVVR